MIIQMQHSLKTQYSENLHGYLYQNFKYIMKSEYRLIITIKIQFAELLVETLGYYYNVYSKADCVC